MSYFIGVMSGTSLDGIDIALTSLSDSGEFHLVAAQTFPFPEDIYSKLQSLIVNQHCTLLELGEIDIALGNLIGVSIIHLLAEHNVSVSEITAIGSHGQTLFHSPNSDLPFSQQIGNASCIAEITGITTVADFRQRDIAAGGQGAPLVPAFHQALFNNKSEDRVIVNIGGISNITLLQASADNAVLGFDTGPGNALIDYWTQLHLEEAYDRSGQWAASGQCNDRLLAELLNENYFQQSVPKSTGRELFNKQWLDDKLSKCGIVISPADVQATLVELTAQTIADDIKAHVKNDCSVYICGGGAHNDFLMKRLQTLLDDIRVSTTATLGLDPDWVEAGAFAWLAYQTINKKAGNLPSVTGATHPVVLGAIYLA